MDAKKSLNTKILVLMALLVALSFIGSHIKIFGTIAFDSLPGFLAALLLGPVYGAAIGFLGHLFTAMTSGFPLSLPLHIVIAVTMAITMFIYGYTYRLLKKKLSESSNLILTGIIGVILNGPVSLAISITALGFLAGWETALGLLALLPALILAAIANITVSSIILKSLERVWNKII